MTSTPESPFGEMPLPDGFSTLEKVRNMPIDLLLKKPAVSVIGFVKGFQPTIKTGGTDFKCSIEITDHSDQGMKVDIFEKVEQNMPPTPAVGDLVLIRDATAQIYRGVVGLLKRSSSEFRFLASSHIPKKEIGASSVPWRSYPPGKCRTPTAAEMKYVLWASNHMDDIDLPSQEQYEVEKVQAMKSNKEKFCLLKGIKPDRYYDILGQVIRVYDSSGTLQVYLSDYTPNSSFHNYEWTGSGENETGREGDEFGYQNRLQTPKKKEWLGPYGKMTIQLTLWDPHACFAREEVKIDDWVSLKNVHIKYGKIGGILEGFMHEDNGRMNVCIIKEEEVQNEDKRRWKEAVTRKREWWKKFEEQKPKFLAEGGSLGNKRTHDGEGVSKSNSKKRRDEKRAVLQKKAAAADAKERERLNLNENIRCNNPDQPIFSLAEILKPRALGKNGEGKYNPSAFTCAKYRANVRIVDFFPDKVEDFAVGRRPSEYDILSDYSGGEDTDREEDMRVFKSGKGFAKNIWEWRFALQVEDASQNGPKERLWLIVNNHVAQGLLNLEGNATNLRGNRQFLSQVKEQLFKLWGDLEEKKSEAIKQQSRKKNDLPQSSFGSDFPASSPPRKVGEMPNTDSDVENEPLQPKSSKKNLNLSVFTERDSNISMSRMVAGNVDKSEANLGPKNKAFTCCIRQYGVKVDEHDPVKANAGHGKKWQRVFGLFETYIV